MNETGQGRRKPGRPRSPKFSEVRTDTLLLEAAIDLFAQRGYDSVSTGDIAKAANYTQSMVHYHFGSKEDIWQAAVHRLMTSRGIFFAPSRLQLNGLAPAEKLTALVTALIEANAEQPRYVAIMVHELAAGSDRLKWIVSRYIRPSMDIFDAVITEAMDAGVMRRQPVHVAATLITTMAALSFSVAPMAQAMYDADVTGSDDKAMLVQAIADMMMHGILLD
ncbi:TetR/AcrR family transcriptional regulator [Sphingobium yanoikuyae]|uniref:TetR/AcrR family transcriptional regulator n=1 Tax=Sphingobium yanoikuyae TaxID=13690 RepID=A0A9X7U4B9_SPHYA|nr:TetR/AcrR family transcriptional regulator [Sphingobium yanoikuyae]QNG43461.1 TetR/AcrR family transcriptional regulator [Sphingobium yanoikuyae]